jgi:2-isopropylmalate synthase
VKRLRKKRTGENKLVSVLDTTLREGEQTPGVYFDRHIKLAIASLLDEVGVDIIETGHPAVTEEIYDAVSMISSKGFKSKIGAHARSVEGDVQMALDCGVGFLGIFYCVSDERLNGIFKNDLNAAIRKITQVIHYAKKRNPDLIIRYTPEDTVRSKFENVLEAAAAAVDAGADIISVADTTGYMIPGTDRSMYDYVSRLKRDLSAKGYSPRIAVHCHNDRGLALANALDGFRAGADIIDASVLGLGERAGIVDLATLLTILAVDFGQNHWNLEKLGELYKLVSKHARISLPANYPVMGENAFTHCAGVHTHAAAENPMHYESLSPKLVGRQTQFSLDHMSGIASLRYALKQINSFHLDEDLQFDILKEVKKIGQRGRIVDLEELKHIVDACKHHKRYSA